jgi:hypothetical protein
LRLELDGLTDGQLWSSAGVDIIAAALQSRDQAARAAETERCARIAGERADNAGRIAGRWSPGYVGNDRTIAYWEARNREALDIAAAIRATAGDGR